VYLSCIQIITLPVKYTEVLSPLETIHAKKVLIEKDNWMKNLTNTTVKKLRKNCSLTNRRVKKEKKVQQHN